LDEDEVGKIGAYLQQGGRMLALGGYGYRAGAVASAGLAPVLKMWNLGMGDSYVLDEDKRFRTGQYDFLTAQMTPHPVTDPLIDENTGIRMVMPRPIYKLDNVTASPGAPQITILANTSTNGHYGRQFGPFALIVAVEQGMIAGVSAPRSGTRLVVAGDADFLSDQNIGSWAANHYFAGLAMNWLLERPQFALAGLAPRPIPERRLYMTELQTRAVRWLFLGAMPGAALCLGGLVWLRRRS